MTADPKNLLGWLPKPGESRKIPGGFIWCREWKVFRDRHTGNVSGEIKFEFESELPEYERAMEKPEEIQCEILKIESSSK